LRNVHSDGTKNVRYASVGYRVKRVYCLVLLVACCMLYGCGSKGASPATAEEFIQWFCGTNAEVPASFKTTTAAQIDSLHQSIMKTRVAGQGSVIMADTLGRQFTLGYCTPQQFRPDTLYPCIIYLHGGNGSSSTSKGEMAWDMMTFVARNASVFLASPSANRDAPWWSEAGLSRILQTVRYMTLHYPVNPQKIICVGVSDGATGCYAVANTIADPFAGFIAVSGFGGMLQQLGMKLYPQNLMQRPIYNINATNDRIYPVAAVNQFLDRLEDAGVGILRKVYENEEHGFDYRARETATICSLVTAWERPIERGISWTFTSRYPVLVPHLLAMQPDTTVQEYSFEAGCYNDTINVKTALPLVTLFFPNDGLCKNDRMWRVFDGKRSISPERSTWSSDYRVMKIRCIPELVPMNYFTLKK